MLLSFRWSLTCRVFNIRVSINIKILFKGILRFFFFSIIHLKILLKVKESEVAQLCPTLCDPVDCSPPCPLSMGFFQARLLEWVAISFSRGSSQPRDWTRVSRIGGRCFTHWATRELEKWLSFLPTTHLFSWLFFLFSERMALHILNLFQFGSFWPMTEQAWGWNERRVSKMQAY